MTIYLDVIWLLNFFIDLLLIWITALALKRTIKKWRLLLAALFASTIVLLLFTPIAFVFYQPWGKVIFSAMIVVFAFGYKRFKYFIQNFLMFYFVTFITGGGLFALHYFWQTDVEILEGVMMAKTTSFGHTFSWVFVIIGLPIMIYFTKKQIEQVEHRKIDYERIVKVEVEIDGKIVTANGLVDSGNQLFDPLTKTPVMIMEKKLIQNAFPNVNIDEISNIDRLFQSNEMEENHPFYQKIRIVPYRVVGKGQDFLVAIKPNRVTIYDGDEKYDVTKVLVGMEARSLSNVGDYETIVHPNMLLRGQNMKLA